MAISVQSVILRAHRVMAQVPHRVGHVHHHSHMTVGCARPRAVPGHTHLAHRVSHATHHASRVLDRVLLRVLSV